MEANAGLVAGSHNRNELVVISRERDESDPKRVLGQSCQICGDEVGLTADGELFVACNECAFPICRTCYEYERREGSQVCPQCKTRFKLLRGSARVAGDEEDDGVDEIENEFSFDGRSRHDLQQALSADAMLHGHMSYGRTSSVSFDFHNDLHPMPQLPLLTNGQMVIHSPRP